MSDGHAAREKAWLHRFSAASCWAQAGNFYQAIAWCVTTCYRSPIFQARCARAYRIMLSSSVHVELNGTQTWRLPRLVRMGEVVFPESEAGDQFAKTVTLAPLRGQDEWRHSSCL